MVNEKLDTNQKALQINVDAKRYGTFAEIGAGQEVARWFFRVGGAAKTVAKTISAYDMAVSDAIYGPTDRYVSRRRLKAMLVEEATVTLGDADDADIVVTDTLHVTDDHPALLVVPGGQVTGFIRGGAVACLPDTLSREDLIPALSAAARGLAVTTAGTLADLAHEDREAREEGLREDEDLAHDVFDRRQFVDLTERERQVLALLAEGKSNKAIARSLAISLHTTKFHVASLLTKLGATGRTDAVAQAIRIGALML